MNNHISRRTVLALLTATAVASTVSAAIAQDALDRIKASGTIRVGYAQEAPLAFVTPEGDVTGEAPEIARAILKEIGIENIEWVATEFSSLIPGLQANRFDMVATGMFITPPRCEQIRFSHPTYGMGQALLVPEGNPKDLRDYSSIADNPDLKLAIWAGGTEIEYAKAAGIDSDRVLLVPDQSSVVAAIQAGRADAGAGTVLAATSMVSSATGIEATEPFDEVAGEYVVGHGGFGFRKEDSDLADAFDAALDDFIGSQAHLELVKPFGFDKNTLPTKTTAELCVAE